MFLAHLQVLVIGEKYVKLTYCWDRGGMPSLCAFDIPKEIRAIENSNKAKRAAKGIG